MQIIFYYAREQTFLRYRNTLLTKKIVKYPGGKLFALSRQKLFKFEHCITLHSGLATPWVVNIRIQKLLLPKISIYIS